MTGRCNFTAQGSNEMVMQGTDAGPEHRLHNDNDTDERR